jgi:hypothetical protein
MSFNGADAAGSSSIDPASTLGGSSGFHELTVSDIVVIVGAVVAFLLLVSCVFYYRQLRAGRAQAGSELALEMGNVENRCCEEDDDDANKAADNISVSADGGRATDEEGLKQDRTAKTV